MEINLDVAVDDLLSVYVIHRARKLLSVCPHLI
jgi:hypothetical protein